MKWRNWIQSLALIWLLQRPDMERQRSNRGLHLSWSGLLLVVSWVVLGADTPPML